MKRPEKALLLTITLLLYCGSTAASANNDGQWVEADGKCSLQEFRAAKARRVALERAIQNAVEKVSGINIVKSNLIHEMDKGTIEGVQDIFISRIQTECRGLVIDQRDTTVILKEGPYPFYEARGEFFVVPEKGDPDPQFGLSMKINNSDGALNLRDGEEMIISLRATKDCYVTIFNFFSIDSLLIIYPNHYLQNNFLKAHKEYEIFPEDMRPSPTLRAGLAPDKDRDQEFIMAVATREDYRFPLTCKKDNPFGQLTHFSDALTKLNRWLMNIPLNERTESSIIYTIYKK